MTPNYGKPVTVSRTDIFVNFFSFLQSGMSWDSQVVQVEARLVSLISTEPWHFQILGTELIVWKHDAFKLVWKANSFSFKSPTIIEFT